MPAVGRIPAPPAALAGPPPPELPGSAAEVSVRPIDSSVDSICGVAVRELTLLKSAAYSALAQGDKQVLAILSAEEQRNDKAARGQLQQAVRAVLHHMMLHGYPLLVVTTVQQVTNSARTYFEAGSPMVLHDPSCTIIAMALPMGHLLSGKLPTELCGPGEADAVQFFARIVAVAPFPQLSVDSWFHYPASKDVYWQPRGRGESAATYFPTGCLCNLLGKIKSLEELKANLGDFRSKLATLSAGQEVARAPAAGGAQSATRPIGRPPSRNNVKLRAYNEAKARFLQNGPSMVKTWRVALVLSELLRYDYQGVAYACLRDVLPAQMMTPCMSPVKTDVRRLVLETLHADQESLARVAALVHRLQSREPTSKKRARSTRARQPPADDESDMTAAKLRRGEERDRSRSLRPEGTPQASEVQPQELAAAAAAQQQVSKQMDVWHLQQRREELLAVQEEQQPPQQQPQQRQLQQPEQAQQLHTPATAACDVIDLTDPDPEPFAGGAARADALPPQDFIDLT